MDYGVTDVESDASLSITRSWTNSTVWSNGQLLGYGWIDNTMPIIKQLDGDEAIAVVYSATDIMSFVLTNGAYVPTTYTADGLVHDETDHLYILTDSSGNQYTYHDFSSNVASNLRGQLVSKIDAYGLLTEADRDEATGRLKYLVCYDANGIAVERWAYSYIASSPNAGLIASVALQRPDGNDWTTIETVTYTYYNGTYTGDDQYGNLGDLKTVITTKGEADGTIISAYYYRYYIPGECRDSSGKVIGYKHGLKYVFNTEDYARLLSARGSSSLSSTAAFSAADSAVRSYATQYFEYDFIRRVTLHNVQGAGTYTYSYSTNTSYTSGTNTWYYRTVETTADGSVNVVYCNSVGDAMLKITYDQATYALVTAANKHFSEATAVEYYQYNDQGQVILKAEGKAIASYSEVYSDLLYNLSCLSTDSGAIYRYTYGTDDTADDATPGEVEGYLNTISVQEGGAGTAVVLLESIEYYVKTDNGQTIVVVASDTVYADSSVSSAQTTSYAYSWYTGTVGASVIEVAITVNGTLTTPVYENAYDTNGRLSQLTDADGIVTTYTYDGLGNVTQVVENDVDTPTNSSSEDVTTTYAYDSLGRVTRMTDAKGYITYYVYNDATREVRTYAGWSSTTHNTTGAITVYREDLFGNYTETLTFTWTDPNGLANYLNADSTPNGTESLTSSHVAIQSLSRSIMDTAGQKVAVREYFNLTALTYSTSRDLGTKYVSGISTANYYETGYEYNAAGSLIRVTDANGVVTAYEYNALGQVTWVCQNYGNGIQDPADDNVITTYAYDTNGNLISKTDASGVTAVYTYNYLNQLIKVCQNYVDIAEGSTADADENVITTYTYDLLGNLLTVTDALGNTTTYTYNAFGEVTSVTDALQSVTTCTYNILGNLVSVTDGEGHTTTYAYNAFGGVTMVTDALNCSTTYEYDAVGNLVSVTDAKDKKTSYEYDTLGQLVTETDPLGNVTTYEYDALGNLLSVTDGEDNETEYAYDKLGQPISVTDGNGDSTSFTYDAVGNLLTVTDADDNTTTYAYDALGRVTSETDELGNDKHYEYDALGNLVEYTDANGRVTQYEYDALGRETAEKWLASTGTVTYTISYTYDATGHLLTASDAAATYTYTYDALGRVDSVTQVLASLSATIVLTYQYDDVGNVSQVAATINDMADYVIDYTYDDLGRVTSIRQHGVTDGNTVAEKFVKLTYDVLGQYATITTYADLLGTQLVATATYTFDDAYELVGLTYTKGTTTLASYAYTYDSAGNITTMTTVDGTTTYTYDPAGQLISATLGGTEVESYTYDDNGNRETANGDTYDTGDDNQLTSDDSYTYTYDAEGNRTTKFVDADGDGLDADDRDITIYTWDYRNRLTEVEHFAAYANYVADTSDQVVRYTYDAFNRLIGRTLDKDGAAANIEDLQKSVYVYDGDQIALQFDKAISSPLPPGEGQGEGAQLSASDFSHRYLWNPQAVDQLFADEQLANDDKVVYALTDHENSVRDLVTYDAVNDVSTVANHRVYDSYGNLTSETANAAVDCLFGYTGRQNDESTGLQNNLNRWYDPAVGRWMSEDPIGFVGGDANLYRYVGNSPTRWVDASGLCQNNRFWEGTPDHGFWENDVYTSGPSIRAAAPVGSAGWYNKQDQRFRNGLMSPDEMEAWNQKDMNPVMAILDHLLNPGYRGLSTLDQAALMAWPFAEGAATAPRGTPLQRPYIRKWVRDAVEAAAPRTADGRPIDPNTGEPINGTPDLGHKPGHEFWREKAKAEAEGLTQEQFNNRMNNPDLYQREAPSSNRSHRFEKPR